MKGYECEYYKHLPTQCGYQHMSSVWIEMIISFSQHFEMSQWNKANVPEKRTHKLEKFVWIVFFTNNQCHSLISYESFILGHECRTSAWTMWRKKYEKKPIIIDDNKITTDSKRRKYVSTLFPFHWRKKRKESVTFTIFRCMDNAANEKCLILNRLTLSWSSIVEVENNICMNMMKVFTNHPHKHHELWNFFFEYYLLFLHRIWMCSECDNMDHHWQFSTLHMCMARWMPFRVLKWQRRERKSTNKKKTFL